MNWQPINWLDFASDVSFMFALVFLARAFYYSVKLIQYTHEKDRDDDSKED